MKNTLLIICVCCSIVSTSLVLSLYFQNVTIKKIEQNAADIRDLKGSFGEMSEAVMFLYDNN